MLLLRIILVLSLIALAVSGALYLFTRDRRYLRFIGQTVKYVVFILIGVLAFLALERVLVML
ncbi:MAG: hypothetical protein IPI73_15765 [Betaproteobacteria bacterium]|nr:hypothetical protein [Betaproteobacteria bacterium]